MFLVFARIAVSSFGGANFWMRRILIEERGWLSDREYVETLALGQLLPGPNVYNLAVMLGHRFAGAAGAAAAIGGFLGPPLVIMVSVGLLYERFGTLSLLDRALNGMSSVAAGLVIANGVRLALALPRRWRPWLFLALAFAGVGALRWPLLGVMGVLAPFAIASAWKEKPDE